MSPAILPSFKIGEINQTNADLVHLHWFQDEMLSVSDIAKINKPLVWTLHDMWAFCGAEPFTELTRWKEGYSKSNRPGHESGLDVNQWTWERKRQHWKNPIHIVTPSRWLANCVRDSALMGDWPVEVIPYAINTDFWQPMDQRLARDLLKLPQNTPLVLFGAIGGNADTRKGFDLLLSAINHLKEKNPHLELVIFGQNEPKNPINFNFPVHYLGHLHDDLTLKIMYNAVDVFALPSRQDNLPNTGLEAMACGIPVVAFDTCGLPDIVEHQKTGYLAKAFDTKVFAEGIIWSLARSQSHEFKKTINDVAIQRYAYPTIAKRYQSLYEKLLNH